MNDYLARELLAKTMDWDTKKDTNREDMMRLCKSFSLWIFGDCYG